jgi:hypothetical protein
MKKQSAARKAAESTIKHEDLVDKIEALGQSAGLDIEATSGNDPRGDLRIKAKDLPQLKVLIKNKLSKKVDNKDE